ncbi:hypothetical protein KKA01_03755, partial [Patescibacteria group bacterium]|nr:hypothetical protein [Patescibacteria group bacterium]
MNKRSNTIWLIILIVVFGLGAYYIVNENATDNTNTTVATNTNASNTNQDTKFVDSLKTPEALASSFAEYEPVIVNVDPQVPAIDVAEDFSNVNNFDQVSYLLSGTNQK